MSFLVPVIQPERRRRLGVQRTAEQTHGSLQVAATEGPGGRSQIIDTIQLWTLKTILLR